MNTTELGTPSSPPPAPRTSNIYVILFGGFMFAGLLLLAWLGTPPRTTAVGQKLPRIDLQPLTSAPEVSNESLKGKVVVLYFWGTWNTECQLEFPEFIKLFEQFADSADVVVLPISCSSGIEYDLEGLKTETTKFLANYDVELPTYSDSAAMTRQQIALLLPNGSLGYPTTLVVDQQGVITQAIEAYIPGEMQKLVTAIRTSLQAAPVAVER